MLLFLQESTPTIVQLLSLLAIIGQVISVALITLLITELFRGETLVGKRIARHGLLIMLIVSLIAVGGSLFFSEIAGWTPCRLCWFQRIFMYPQMLLLALALWKKDRSVASSVLLLCLVGLPISLIHYREQILAVLQSAKANALVPCDETGVSCAATQIFKFGYVTIPLMAFTAFLMNALFASLILRHGGEEEK
jgi:disulfide bond formation protein DsbB